MNCPAFLLLPAAILSGCVSPSGEDAEALQYRKLFEAGRRAEAKGDIKIAVDTYGWLIGRGNRYGEYGLAVFLLRREPGSREAIKNLIACAKRSSHTSDLFPDSAMDSAFSIAAMDKLADIAISELDRHDVAASLRSTMSDVVTPQVKAWAEDMKADEDSAAIYSDVIAAVESCRSVGGYVKTLKWTEIGEPFWKNGSEAPSPHESGPYSGESKYSVVRFTKAQDAACRYDFEVSLTRAGTFDISESVKSAIRRQLVKEFIAENPHDNVDEIRMSFLAWNQDGTSIKGSAVVMKIGAVRLEYDAFTSRGKIAVRLDGRDVDSARRWALDNIAELAKSKHVVLVAGKTPPPGAQYMPGSERTTEDGLLEIEFYTIN